MENQSPTVQETIYFARNRVYPACTVVINCQHTMIFLLHKLNVCVASMANNNQRISDNWNYDNVGPGSDH